MMQTFRTESNYRSANRLSPAELRAAMANREILQSTALAFDTQRQLRFELGGTKAVMPFAQCADGAENGSVSVNLWIPMRAASRSTGSPGLRPSGCARRSISTP